MDVAAPHPDEPELESVRLTYSEIEGALDRLDDLAESGFIVLGGPLGDEQSFLHICVAEDEDEVRARLGEDPWPPSMLETASVDSWQILLGHTPGR